MKTSFGVVSALLFFVFVPSLIAQAVEEQEVREEPIQILVVPDSALREDLRRATVELRRAVSESERKLTVETLEAREAAESRYQGLLSQAELMQEKLRAEIAEASLTQQKMSEESEERTKKAIFYGFGALALLFSVAFAVVVVFRKETKTTPLETAPHREHYQEILKDPGVLALKEFSRQHGGVSKVMFLLTLPERNTKLDGAEIVCVAELREDFSPLVHFEGERVPVAWEKRRKKAAEIVARRKTTPSHGG